MHQTSSNRSQLSPHPSRQCLCRSIHRSSQNNISTPIFLFIPSSSSNVKTLFSFIYCVCLLVCRSRRSERGVPRARVQCRVPRAGAGRPVPRAGASERLRGRQVQSHPLMHIYPMFYNHNLLACFTKLHCFTIKTWLDSHPLIAIIIP